MAGQRFRGVNLTDTNLWNEYLYWEGFLSPRTTTRFYYETYDGTIYCGFTTSAVNTTISTPFWYIGYSHYSAFTSSSPTDDELRLGLRRIKHQILKRRRNFRYKELRKMRTQSWIHYWEDQTKKHTNPTLIRVDRKRGRWHVGA